MNDLSKSLKILVDRYPGTMTELARQAQIDRSSLYKILDGKRMPNRAQLQRLIHALGLSTRQAEHLTTQYDELRSGAQAHRTDEALYELLQTALRSHDHLMDNVVTPAPRSEADLEAAWRTQCFQGYQAVTQQLYLLLIRYLRSDEKRPLMLSPFVGEHALSSILISAFSAEASPKPVWHLLRFVVNNETQENFIGNVRTVSRALPFLMLRSMQYEARLSRSPFAGPLPGILMPVYVLFPDVAVMMDFNLQKCICYTEPSIVQCLRMEFSRQYLEAPVLFALESDAHSFAQSMEFGNQLLDGGIEACYMRAQPPLSKFIDMDLIARYAPQAMSALETMPCLADYLQAWTTAPYEFYFSEDGLMSFARTGCLTDVDPALTGPLPPEARRELLLRMRAACENGPSVLRIVSAEAFPLDPRITVTAYRGRSVVFCTLSDDPREGFCREYTMQDVTLANRLADYMSNLKDSSLVRTQRYTLEYIDFCLRLL